MKLFYDDEFDALNQMIANSSKSSKELACYLFPEKKPDTAYARLKACLNPDKDERLTFGQIIASMAFCERYDPLMYACDETLHGRPDRKSAEDEAINLMEVINGAASTMERAMKAIDHLKSRGSMRSVA